MRQKILVAGGSGLLGEALARQLCRNHEVVATYQTNEARLPFGCGRSVKIDLSERDLALQLFRDQKFDVVINCAGATAVDRCETDHDYVQKGNVDVVDNLLEAGQSAKFRLIQISTDYVFDGNDGPPTEQWKPNPINVYGTSKLVAEEKIGDSTMPCTILRVCALYSASPAAKTNTLKSILTALKSGSVYAAADDLYSNPTEVNELATAIEALLSKADLPRLLHVAPGEYLSRYQFALKVAETIGADAELVRAAKVDDMNLAALRPKFAGLRSDFAAAILSRELKSATDVLRALISR
ncbi:MAG: SDR family oxidoreductase [Candidatus Zixiibacteriota bacterium]